MPSAGFTSSQGDLSIAGVVFAGMVGSVLGALPLYLAMTLAYLGTTIYIGPLILVLALLVLVGVLHFTVILREEHYLGRKFGAYKEYKARTRRWLKQVVGRLQVSVGLKKSLS